MERANQNFFRGEAIRPSLGVGAASTDSDSARSSRASVGFVK